MCHSIVRHRGLYREAWRAMYHLASLHYIWALSFSACLRMLSLVSIRIQGATVTLIVLFHGLVVLSCCALGRRLLRCE
jgi:hypothetical protein